MNEQKGLHLKDRLRQDGQLLGTWAMCRDMFFVEIAADVGYDVILIESEHYPLSMGNLLDMLIAIRGSGALPMVRMPWNDQVAIKQVLDMGAEGMVVPMIKSAEDAARLVDFSMYPPVGNRGWSPIRAARRFSDRPDYAASANEDTFCLFPQIEHIDAVNAIDEICATPGLDGIFLGPADLSLSMGIPKKFDHPDFIAARDHIWEASKRHGIHLAVTTLSDEDAEMWIDRGVKIIFRGSDLFFMESGSRAALQRLRKRVG